jgi:hypothetical protein
MVITNHHHKMNSLHKSYKRSLWINITNNMQPGFMKGYHKSDNKHKYPRYLNMRYKHDVLVKNKLQIVV